MALSKIQAESMNLADTYAFSGTVTGAGGVNTPSFCATRGTNDQSITANTWTKLQFNLEIYDEGGVYDHSSTYRFTPNVAGKYYVFMNFMSNVPNTHQYGAFYLNGSGYYPIQVVDGSQGGGVFIGTILNLNGSSDYIEAYTYQGTNNGNFESTTQYNIFGAYRIIGA